MFPALTSEFIKAENQYRHERAHGSFHARRGVRLARTRRAAGDAPWPLRPTVDAVTWRTRSA